uniref:PARP-type domain-containing protein n=1 Tax=Panagrolaimus davidi TaxID=227884 RepID=A0A914Q7R0_9BILA
MSYQYNDKVQLCYFQYAISDRSTCGGCQKIIPLGSLRGKCEYGSRFYHFDCFFKYETTTKCNKNEIMIAVKRIERQAVRVGYEFHYFEHENAKYLVEFEHHPYASLEILEKNLDQIVPIVRSEDIDRIRYHVALAQEGITPYYVPKIEFFVSCPYCLPSDEENPFDRLVSTIGSEGTDRILYHTARFLRLFGI